MIARSPPSPYLKILAHSTSRMASPSSPPTPYAIALFVVSRRDMVASVRRAVASASSAPCSVSRAWVIVSRWRCRSCRMEVPSS